MPMLHPEKFVKLGIDPPKGVLCYGAPGTGKTLLARAVANRTDACFIRVIGSELVQKCVSSLSLSPSPFMSLHRSLSLSRHLPFAMCVCPHHPQVASVLLRLRARRCQQAPVA